MDGMSEYPTTRLDASGEPLRLMAVHAHPDDESSKGAATMARYVGEGVQVLVVTCTGGERGDILNPRLDTPEKSCPPQASRARASWLPTSTTTAETGCPPTWWSTTSSSWRPSR